MRRLAIFCFFAVVSQLSAQAADTGCPPITLPPLFKGETCSCGRGLSKLPDELKARLQLSGFELVSACDAKRVPEEPNHFLGKFHLRGTKALAGRLRLEMTEGGGLFLILPESSQRHSSYIDTQLRFANERAAWKKLGLPQVPVGQGFPCKEAAADLVVTELAVLRDYGTDYDGTYILSFRPNSVGTLTSCK